MTNATTIATLTDDTNESVSDLIVFPNPAKENVNVKWNGNATSLIVLNANGQVINTYDLNEVTELNLNNLNTGVYFIKITDNTNSLTQKLIVE
jgi:outer membrane lipoprotein-sorting protein